MSVCWDLREQKEIEDSQIKRLLESLLLQAKEQGKTIPDSEQLTLPSSLRLLLIKEKITGFERLISQYGKLFHQIAWGVLYSYDLAQDAVSEAYVKIYHWLEDTEPEKIMEIDLLPYLCKVVLNISLTHLSREKGQRLRKLRIGELLLVEQRLLMTTDEILEREEKFRILHEEIDQLPTKYRQAIQLRYLLDEAILRGLCEIASERYKKLSMLTGVSEEALRTRVRRGLRLLKLRLSARGIDSW